ncbi:MAG: lysophospholipid acyltransferase family protein [Armatimonadetes bacterium]|nr:lysophospholipid acyltransferase family protein [Armatimonadota bacterium]
MGPSGYEELPIPKRPRPLLSRVGRWISGSAGLMITRLGCLPSLPKLRYVVNSLLYVSWPFIHRSRAKMWKSMHECLGEELSQTEIRDLVRRTVQNIYFNGLLTFRLECMSPDDLRELIEVRGREHLDAALARGKGVLAIGAHLGPFTLIGARLAVDGYPYSVVIRIASDARLERRMRTLREKFNVRSYYRGSETRNLLYALRRNEIVHLFVDQHTSVGGAVVDFFGLPAPSFTGPAVLSYRLAAPVLPIFIVPDPQRECHWIMEIGRPYELPRTGNRDQDVLMATQMFSDTIEDYIRRYPDQWFWMHRRWLRPTDRPKLVMPHLMDKIPEEVLEALEAQESGESAEAASGAVGDERRDEGDHPWPT